jgi:hypothetical protein
MVIEPIKSFVIEKIVKSGIMWIVSLLNPASAFIKACKAIYDIIMFVVERGAEMMEFVGAVIDSIGAVAKGGIGAMVSKIEGVLSKALPLAISFLASLLGLGGISEKIRSIIDTVRAPINKAIDWVVGGAVKAFKKMFKGAIGWVKGKYEKGKAYVKGKVDSARKWGKDKVQGVKDRLRGKGKEPDVDDERSAAIKAEAGAEYGRRASGPLASLKEIQDVAAGVLADLRPKGLKALKAVPHKDDPTTVDIVATASPDDTVKVVKYNPAGKDYTNPTDPDIAAEMTAAGITSFGPYIWDSRVPRFKLDPAFTAWTDVECMEDPAFQPESKAVAGEQGTKAALIAARRKAALQAVFGKTQGVALEIMKVKAGKAPRDFASLGAEDGYSGGHSADRHILGQGKMTGHREVALRAAFQRVGGVPMPLDGAGTASVFSSESAASAAVQAALAQLAASWVTHRRSLAEGTQVKLTVPVAVSSVAYTKRDAPVGTEYPDTEMPSYIDSGKPGVRELYPGDYRGPGRPADAKAPDPAKPSLTTGGAVTQGNVYVIIDPNAGAPGGWAIYTAYPKP